MVKLLRERERTTLVMISASSFTGLASLIIPETGLPVQYRPYSKSLDEGLVNQSSLFHSTCVNFFFTLEG